MSIKLTQEQVIKDFIEVHNAPCADCKCCFPAYVMDFDHRNPVEKLFHISKPPSFNKELIINEIEKCDIVCANCHRIRTFTNIK